MAGAAPGDDGDLAGLLFSPAIAAQVARGALDHVGMGGIEVEDVNQSVEGGLRVDAFLRIGVDIVAEEDDLVIFSGMLLGVSPEGAAVDIGDDQDLLVLFHRSFHL